MTQLQKYFHNDIVQCEQIMDWATSDERADSDAWHTHADIIHQHFQGVDQSGDWCWQEAIELWQDEDIETVINDYKEEA